MDADQCLLFLSNHPHLFPTTPTVYDAMAHPTQPITSEPQSTAIDLPHPRSRESPRFSGKPRDLHDFLFDFQLLIDRHHLTEEERFFHIVRYVVPSVCDTITGMVEYQEDTKDPQTWNKFLKAFKDIYDYAKMERKYTVKDLMRFIDKTCRAHKFTNFSDYNRYLRRFLRIAGWLAARKKIGLDQHHRDFWLGIPKATRKKLEMRILQVTPTIDRTIPYPLADVTSAAEHVFDDTVFYDAYASDSDEEEKRKPTRHRSNGRRKKYDTDSGDSDLESDSSDSDDEDTEPEDAEAIRRYQRREKQKKEKEKEKAKEKGKDKEARPKKTTTRSPQHADLPQDMDVDAGDLNDDMPDLVGQLQNMRLEDPEYACKWYTIVRRDPDMKNYLDPPPRRSVPTPRPITTPAPFARSFACYFCGEQGHGTQCCSKADELIAAGKITRADDGRIAWTDGTTVSRNRDETLHAAVQRQLATNPISVKRTNLILATSLSAQQDSDSEEASYTEDRSEGYVYQLKKAYPVARARDERKAERRHVRFDGVFPPSRPTRVGSPSEKRNPLAQTSATANPTTTLPTGPEKAQATITEIPPPPVFDPYDSDQVMEDLEHIQAPHHQAKEPRPKVTNHPTQKPKKPDGPRLQSSLGRQVDVNSLVKKVLGTPLSISLGDFLGTSPHCSKILKDYLTITRPATLAPASGSPVGKTNLITDPADAYHPGKYLDRSTVLIQLKVSFDNGVTTKALIDPGSEMDIISEKTWMDIETPMDPTAKLVMEDAGAHLLPMKGICRNVTLQAGSLSTTANLWVARIAFPLLLGRPWQRRNRISIEERKSGTWLCHRGGPGDTKLWQICALPAKNSAPFLEGDHPENPITLDDHVHHSLPHHFSADKVFRIRNRGQDRDNPILIDENNSPELPFPDDGYQTEQGDLSDEE